MVKSKKHRAGVKKRNRILKSRKQQLPRPIITSIEIGRFLSDDAIRNLRRAADKRRLPYKSKTDPFCIDLTDDHSHSPPQTPPHPQNTVLSSSASSPPSETPSPPKSIQQTNYTAQINSKFRSIENFAMMVFGGRTQNLT